MKKIFFLLALVSLFGLSPLYAQNSTAVTLHHESTVTNYSTLDAAFTASRNGDVIVLSSGTFTLSNVNKRITIKGAGKDYTTISSAISIQPGVKFEGVNFTGRVTTYPGIDYTIEFLKCGFASMLDSSSGREGAMFLFNCEIPEGSSLTCRENVRISCINSVIYSPHVLSDESSFNCLNCLVYFDGRNINSVYSYPSTMHNSIFENTIFRFTSNPDDNYKFPASVSATHCWSAASIIFRSLANVSENFVHNANEFVMFENNSFWVLTSDAKAVYVGTDGKEIGIYGGYLPWNTVTSVPRISKFKVATKAENNKLNVEISVNGAE